MYTQDLVQLLGTLTAVLVAIVLDILLTVSVNQTAKYLESVVMTSERSAVSIKYIAS